MQFNMAFLSAIGQFLDYTVLHKVFLLPHMPKIIVLLEENSVPQCPYF